MISTHILDTSKGSPAAGVPVVLEHQFQGLWKVLATELTNSDGRIVFDCPREPGTYRLNFEIESYFKGKESFFLNTPVVFKITDIDRNYHVPLLLNPYGYSTYRGS